MQSAMTISSSEADDMASNQINKKMIRLHKLTVDSLHWAGCSAEASVI